MSIISERIKELRHEKKLTQKQLAEKIGISEISIRKYESGDRIPKFEVVEKLASVFNVQFDYIVGRSDNKTFDDYVICNDFQYLLKAIEDSPNSDISKLVRNIIDTMYLTIIHDVKDNNLDRLSLIYELYRNIWEIKNGFKSNLTADILELNNETTSCLTIENQIKKQTELINDLFNISENSQN